MTTYWAVIVVLLANVWLTIAGLINGTTYFYQSLLGALQGYVYLTLCTVFNQDITFWCE